MKNSFSERVLSRASVQVKYAMARSRSAHRESGMDFTLSRLSMVDAAKSRVDVSVALSDLRQIIEVEAKRINNDFISVMLGLNFEWEAGAMAALNIVYDITNSEDMKDGLVHPDGYHYTNYLDQVRVEMGIPTELDRLPLTTLSN